MTTKEHGTLTPVDHPSANRGNHTVEGFVAVASEAARTAIVQVAADRGREVFQTGGTTPGWYRADGAGGWLFVGAVGSAVAVHDHTSGTQGGLVALSALTGTINDTQHGSRGGGSLHALAIASGAAGFMSGADKAKLDAVPTGGGMRQSTAAEITVDTTTTSATFVSLLSAPITIAAGGILLITFTVGATNDTKDKTNFFRVLVDGTPLRGTNIVSGIAGSGGSAAIALRVTGLAAGARSVTAEWRTDGGTARIRPVANPDGAHATLLVQEVGS